MIPLIDLARQHGALAKKIRRVIDGVLNSQRFILNGALSRFESEIAGKLGCRHALGVASGSDALYLSLVALGVGPGDEVITTPFSFFATAGAVSRTGARPVFADIDPRTFNLDPKKVRSAVTKRTKAVVPVHLFGLPCDMDAILKIAGSRGLAVVEDAAQSFGAKYRGRRTGAIGDAGCLSFYPTKNLGGVGDGGMVVTSSAKIAQKLRLLRDHGQAERYHHRLIGLNSRLDDLQAAVLSVKLKKVDRWNAQRQRYAAEYGRQFQGLPLALPAAPPDRTHVYHLYSVLCKKRDALAKFLAARGIGTGVYYPLPLHLQPCYKPYGYRRGDFPVSEKVSREILALPVFPELKDSERERVADVVKAFFK